MTALLALDLGTATGWALRTPDGAITSDTQSFRPGRFEGGGMRFPRFLGLLLEVQATVGPIGGHEPWEIGGTNERDH